MPALRELAYLRSLGPWGALASVRARGSLIGAVGARHAWEQLKTDARDWDQGDRRRASARLMWSDAARELGASFSVLSEDVIEISRGDVAVRIGGYVQTPMNSAVAIRVAADKALARRLLSRAGIPVPDGLVFDGRDSNVAVEFARVAGTCVVKPARETSGGTAVTTGVRSDDDVRAAVDVARRASQQLVIEKQVDGDFYRLLVLDGRLLDALRRDPPHLTGDGQSSVKQLVEAENARRLSLPGPRRPPRPLILDLDALFTLRHSGLQPNAVPPAGKRFIVRQTINQNGERDNRSLVDSASSDSVTLAVNAAAALDLRLAGVDVLATDISAPLEESNVTVLEVNPIPGYEYHYTAVDASKHRPVAEPILETLLAEAADRATRRTVRA